MSYNIFADYYDVLMQNVGYKERSDYICELMKRHNHEFGITLDPAFPSSPHIETAHKILLPQVIQKGLKTQNSYIALKIP